MEKKIFFLFLFKKKENKKCMCLEKNKEKLSKRILKS